MPQPGPDYFGFFDASPNLYLVLDRNLNIVAANQAHLRATKRDLSDLVGRRAWDAFPTDPETLRASVASFEGVLRDRKPTTLPLLRFDIPKPEAEGGGFDARYWSVVLTPVLDDAGEVSAVLQHSIDVTELQRLREAARSAGPEQPPGKPPPVPAPVQMGILRRAQSAQETNRTLRAESGRLRQLFQQAPGFMCVLRGPDHRFELANDAYLHLIGYRAVVGKPLLDALPELAGQCFVELLDKVRLTGEAFVGRELRFMVRRTADAPLEECFVDFVYQPILDDDGSVTGIFVEGSEVTARALAVSRQRLLIAELNHRVKNTLATIQSIAAQTLRSHPAPETFRRSFEARLVALALTHDALTRPQWQGANIRSLLQQELGPYGESRALLQGPNVLLHPNAAVPVGMIIHELAANAAKFGALSVGTGQVSVRWRTTDDGANRMLHVEWTESGGPAVAAPDRRGFGARLIERSFKGGIGEAHLEFRREGVVARIRMRLAASRRKSTTRCAQGDAGTPLAPALRKAERDGAVGPLADTPSRASKAWSSAS